ncbi:ParB N-terminal domain-containing protein [Micromonospora sp. NPDC005710]|uniref:ParB/RepB/Spo0J family partition protein n=1 Tax=Micromonospora sp. NPDC005710 TaxID=3157051 RepID=UPI0033DD8562
MQLKQTQFFTVTSANSILENVSPVQHLDLLRGGVAPTCRVPVSALLPADSPRSEGEDQEHIRVLASIEAKLPPIIVHRATMRVIDGMHRLAAAKLRDDETIEVRFFEGTEREAFVLAVKANIAHGRPLSLNDRTSAAERIMVSHPAWSDRAIAVAAGISARLVGNLRRRLAVEDDSFDEARSRVGRDGRVRPLDNAEGRLKAAEVIRESPMASLREIGKRAGISPATASDVRKRIERGEDPVPGNNERAERRPARPARRGGDPADEPDIEAMLHGLRVDPSLRFSETGRDLLRWVLSKALRPGEWKHISDGLPPHATYILADVARQCADEWREIADDLDQRSRRMA